MPWAPSDAAAKNRKADTPRKKGQWAAIANNVLKRTGDDRQAVKTANGVLKKAAARAGK